MLPVVTSIKMIRPLSTRSSFKKANKFNDFSALLQDKFSKPLTHANHEFIDAEWEEILDEDSYLSHEAPWLLYKRAQNMLAQYRHQINFYT